MVTPVYEPDDDSYLLLDVLQKELQDKEAQGKALVRMNFLDMGAGNGFLGFAAVKKGLRVTFADINPEAIQEITKMLLSEAIVLPVVQTDLFTKLQKEYYDFIVFNTPYLPADKNFFDPALHGGQEGNETAIRFIKQAKEHLKKEGVILLLTSNLAKPEKIKQVAQDEGFILTQVAHQKLFFEELLVYKLQ